MAHQISVIWALGKWRTASLNLLHNLAETLNKKQIQDLSHILVSQVGAVMVKIRTHTTGRYYEGNFFGTGHNL